jgi:plastocyanin
MDMPRLLGIALVAVALALGACGGDDEEQAAATPEATETPAATETPQAAEDSGGGGTKLALSSPADGAIEFDKTELTAEAGSVTIDYDNPSSTPHAVEIEGNGVEEETETITEGKDSLTVDLEPGEYTFYCPVGQHRQNGMEGTLTVE